MARSEKDEARGNSLLGKRHLAPSGTSLLLLASGR